MFWILHLGVFPLFLAMMISVTKQDSSRLTAAEQQQRSVSARLFAPRNSATSILTLIRPLPTWARAVVVAVFIYVGANFMASIRHLPQKGDEGRTMSGEQVNELEVDRYTARAFSGHWLIFYLLPALHFLYKPAQTRNSIEERDVGDNCETE